jgi:hypothetical protein
MMKKPALKRREILWGPLAIGAVQIVGSQTAMAATYREQAFDIASLIKRWPEGRSVPQLILDVAEYIGDKPWGSLGYTRMLGDRLDDNWILNGADLWPHFAYFIGFADGSHIAQWFVEGAASTDGPIVLIGSEGEQMIVAKTVEELFARWALDGTSVNGGEISAPLDMAYDDEDQDEVPDGRPAFLQFLQQRLGVSLETLLTPESDHAPLQSFFTTWEEAQRKKTRDDPTMQAIAKLLDKHIPRGKEPWERTSISIQVAGDRMEFKGPLFGEDNNTLPFPERTDLIPLVFKAREQRAQGIHVQRGLWHQANLFLSPDGFCTIAASWDPPWDAEPVFKDGSKPTTAEIDADLKRFPRSAGWMEKWMMKM